MRKELYEGYFKDKKVTVMGLGLLGRGVGDTAFLARHGARLIVTDKKTQESLSSSLEALEPYHSISFVLGEHRKEDFKDRDYILKSAGVPYDSEYIEYAKSHHVPIYMSAALMSDIVMKHLESATIIGVTGTRGKSTVTQLIAHILKSSNVKVHLGGNVRGVANLPLLESIDDGDFLVLELDSWQLQGFGDMKISPHIAVFTSFLDDHMNYYHNDKELYFNDKANIYRNQQEYDALIASPQAFEEIHARDKDIHAIVPENHHFEMKLIGEHNQVAARLAYEVSLQCGLHDEEIKNAIASFEAVEGRLEDLGLFTEKNIHVFNDNNATTPDATIAAINAIAENYNKKPILIIGGTDKGLPLSLLEETIQSKTKDVVYLSGTGTNTLTLPKKYEYEDLKDCVQKAFSLGEEGDVILFSPAFASFSKYFNNEYERNDMFVKVINSKKYDTNI
jgi:UDP-N-acetylmuramoylalanine--D-glutamate ligase